MSNPNSSSIAQSLSLLLLSGCALAGFYYLRRKDEYPLENSETAVNDSNYWMHQENIHLESVPCITCGMNRFRTKENRIMNIKEEVNVYDHQVAGHTKESKSIIILITLVELTE